MTRFPLFPFGALAAVILLAFGLALLGDWNVGSSVSDAPTIPPGASAEENGSGRLSPGESGPGAGLAHPLPSEAPSRIVVETEPAPAAGTDPYHADLIDLVAKLQAENGRLTKRVEWLEIELDLLGSEITQGPIGRWLKTLLPEERPGARELRLVAEYLRPYPVELTPDEGLWVAERIRKDDWKLWGNTIDEAILLHLGPQRLIEELPEERLAVLREEWAEEGWF